MKSQVRTETRERLDVIEGIQPSPSPHVPLTEYVGMCEHEDCYMPAYRKVGGRIAACGNGHTRKNEHIDNT